MASSQNPSRSSSALSEVAEGVQELGGRLKHAAQEGLAGVNEKVVEYYEKGRDKAHEYGEEVEGYVKSNPFKAVLLAIGAGALLGMFLTRRR